MTIRPLALVASAFVASAAACATPRPPEERLEPRASFSVAYDGAITTEPPSLEPAADHGASREVVGGGAPSAAASVDGPPAPVDARVVEVDRRAVSADLGLSELGVTAVAVDSAVLNRAMKRLHDGRIAHELSTPRLLTRDGQRASVATATQHSYVGGFGLQGNEHGLIADPAVKTASEGTVLSVRPTFAEDRASVALEMALQVNILLRPIPETRARVFSGPPVSVQLPVFLAQHLETNVRLTNGTSIVVSGLSTDDPETLLLALVTVRVVDPSSGEKRVVIAR